MSTRCSRALDSLGDPVALAALGPHLESCADCRALVEAHARLRGIAPPSLDPIAAKRIREGALAELTSAPRPRPWWLAALVLTAIGLGAGAAGTFFMPRMNLASPARQIAVGALLTTSVLSGCWAALSPRRRWRLPRRSSPPPRSSLEAPGCFRIGLANIGRRASGARAPSYCTHCLPARRRSCSSAALPSRCRAPSPRGLRLALPERSRCTRTAPLDRRAIWRSSTCFPGSRWRRRSCSSSAASGHAVLPRRMRTTSCGSDANQFAAMPSMFAPSRTATV